MPTDSERLAQLDQAVRLLRDQVDVLQLAAAEKKTPWYRQMPSLAGLIALLLSISTAIYSGVQGRKQDVQKKQESLRGIVSSLIDLSGEQQTRLASAEAQKLSTQEREFIGGMINNRRMILAEAADNIVREIPQDVSSSEYNVLATDKLANGGTAKAEEYLRNAVGVSQEPLAKMIALRSLAMFYAQRGPFQSIDEARKRFQEAVDVLPGEPRDDATAYTVGFTWEMWGTAEYMNNFPQAGEEKIANARHYYSDLSAGNPVRNWALLFLDTRMQYYERGTASPPPPALGPVPPAPTFPIPSQSPGMTQPEDG